MILVDHSKVTAVILGDGSCGSPSENCCDPAWFLLYWVGSYGSPAETRVHSLWSPAKTIIREGGY